MKEWRAAPGQYVRQANKRSDLVVYESLTVSELIMVLMRYPEHMPVVGTYEGIYGDMKDPVVQPVSRGRDTFECLVFDIEYSGQE